VSDGASLRPENDTLVSLLGFNMCFWAMAEEKRLDSYAREVKRIPKHYRVQCWTWRSNHYMYPADNVLSTDPIPAVSPEVIIPGRKTKCLLWRYSLISALFDHVSPAKAPCTVRRPLCLCWKLKMQMPQTTVHWVVPKQLVNQLIRQFKSELINSSHDNWLLSF